MEDDGRADPRAEVLSALTGVLDMVGRMNGSLDITASLQDVLDALLEATGFRAGAINYVRSDGAMEIVAVTGPDGAREALLGVELPPGALDRELATGERWGRLHFLPHGVVPTDVGYVWVPDLPLPTSPDGWHPADSLLVPLYEEPGRLIGVLSVDMPVTGLRPDAVARQLLELLAGQAETALQNARRASRLRASEESFRLAFEATSVGTGLISVDHRDPLRLLRSNRALLRIAEATGGSPVAVLSELLDPADADHDADRWRSVILAAPGGVYRAEKQLRGAGERSWVQVLATVLPLHSTEPGRAIVQIEDVTERRRVQGDLHHRATSDPLTGLPNRARLDDRLAAAIARVREGGPPGALLFCDLDDFKTVNDVFGHLAGDAVLRACARRLTSHVRRDDAVFRLGGDEFVVLVADCPAGEIGPLVVRIKADVGRAVEHEGRRLRVGLSVGAAAVDGSSGSVDHLLATADAAMYADKRGRTGRRKEDRGAPSSSVRHLDDI